MLEIFEFIIWNDNQNSQKSYSIKQGAQERYERSNLNEVVSMNIPIFVLSQIHQDVVIQNISCSLISILGSNLIYYPILYINLSMVTLSSRSIWLKFAYTYCFVK